MSKYINQNGYIPNTPIEVIIKDFKKEVNKNNLKEIEPIAQGIYGFKVPVWPVRYQGQPFTYAKNIDKNGIEFYSLKWDSLTIPERFAFDFHNMPVPNPVLTKVEELKKVKYSFLESDYNNNPYLFFVISSSDYFKDKLSLGDIIFLKNGNGGMQEFMHNGSRVSFIPGPSILGKINKKGVSNE